MIRLVVLAPGSLAHPAAVTWGADYCRRIGKMALFERKKVRQARRTRAGEDLEARRRESADLVRAIAPGAFVALIDGRGLPIDCDQLCDKVRKIAQNTGRAIWFVLGGPDGVDDDVRARADEIWSLSALTLSHDLAEIVLLEQLYRALTRLHGLPYHR